MGLIGGTELSSPIVSALTTNTTEMFLWPPFLEERRKSDSSICGTEGFQHAEADTRVEEDKQTMGGKNEGRAFCGEDAEEHW